MIALTLLAVQVSNQPVEGTNYVQRNTSRTGYAAHYSKGRMERVARARDLPIVRCMVASSYYRLGTTLSVYSHATGATALCSVYDVTAQRDVAAVRRRNIVLEFGAANIKQMCGLDHVGQEPPSKCPVTVKLVS